MFPSTKKKKSSGLKLSHSVTQNTFYVLLFILKQKKQSAKIVENY